MGEVESDPQAIEKRDFPLARRGYSPAAVDAHLRAVASDVDQLRRTVASLQGEDSMASSAGAQVRSIIEAAEAAAADIKNQARATAGSARGDADRDAETIRAQAIAQAEAHVTAVAKASAVLLARIESMGQDLSALLEELRRGATRLTGELATIQTNMREQYDAAGGAFGATDEDRSATAIRTTAPLDRRATSEAAVGASGGEVSPERNGDLDGARLTALNMALSGEPREQTDRYLAEHFQLPEREKLIAEVYAAIEG
jgi:DivIVA domain-containing protein